MRKALILSILILSKGWESLWSTTPHQLSHFAFGCSLNPLLSRALSSRQCLSVEGLDLGRESWVGWSAFSWGQIYHGPGTRLQKLLLSCGAAWDTSWVLSSHQYLPQMFFWPQRCTSGTGESVTHGTGVQGKENQIWGAWRKVIIYRDFGEFIKYRNLFMKSWKEGLWMYIVWSPEHYRQLYLTLNWACCSQTQHSLFLASLYEGIESQSGDIKSQGINHSP